MLIQSSMVPVESSKEESSEGIIGENQVCFLIIERNNIQAVAEVMPSSHIA